MDKIYITTTLPYVNALPHIGHTLEFIQADVYTRYYKEKLGSKNVFFNLGVDEHGLKVYLKSKIENLSPQELSDKYAEKWKEFCKLYLIEYNNFYRTTDSKHAELAKKFWKDCQTNGDIYKKSYSGKYCVGCEAFKTDKDLINGKCIDHDAVPIELTEENYFFRLSKYTEQLGDFLKQNPNFVSPEDKQKVLQNFVNQGLQDVSISRVKKNLPWGIEVPDDPEQVMYVWFDALTNYIFAVGYGTDNESFNNWWPTVVQICGTDNLRFQGALWQGMLCSQHLPYTKKLLVHGMINDSEGRKMSKTIGNVISPFEIYEKYGVEAVRLYLITAVSSYHDFAFSEERLKFHYNDALADKFGNLLNRVIHLANIYDINLSSTDSLDMTFIEDVDSFQNRFTQFIEDFQLDLAYEQVYKLSALGNEYITLKEPWKKNKTKNEIKTTLKSLTYLLRLLIKDYLPVIPLSCQKAENILDNYETGVLFKKFE